MASLTLVAPKYKVDGSPFPDELGSTSLDSLLTTSATRTSPFKIAERIVLELQVGLNTKIVPLAVATTSQQVPVNLPPQQVPVNRPFTSSTVQMGTNPFLTNVSFTPPADNVMRTDSLVVSSVLDKSNITNYLLTPLAGPL